MKYLSGMDIYILLYSVSERTWKKGSVGWKWSPWWFRFSLDFQGLPNLGYSNLGGLRCAYFSTHLHTAAAVYQLFFFVIVVSCLLFKGFIYLPWETGEEREKKGETHWLVASHTLPAGDQACNPGMCPDRKSSRGPCSLQASTPSTEPHQPGHRSCFEVDLIYNITTLFHTLDPSQRELFNFNTFLKKPMLKPL